MFVGDSHRSALERLVAAFHEVRQGGRPRLVIVVGEPGAGKTRVVQELFGRLAAWEGEQARLGGAPPFWPAGVVEADAPLLSQRGRVLPRPFATAPKAEPRFMWHGLSCEVDGEGVPRRSLLTLGDQLELVAAAALYGFGRGRRRLGLAAKGGLMALTFFAAAAGLVWSVPWLAWVSVALFPLEAAWVWLDLHRWRDEVKAERERGRRWQTESVVGSEGVSSTLADARSRLLDSLRRTAEAGLVSVVVVDDAPWADDAVVEVLAGVLGGRWPVLVVATARPAPLRLLEMEGEGFGALTGPAAQYPGREERLLVGPLGEADLVSLVRAAYPGTPDAVAESLAAWCHGSPLLLRGFLELPTVRDSVAGSGLHLSPEDLEGLLASVPADIRGVFHRYWGELPPAVQRTVAFAAFSMGNHIVPEAVVAGLGAAFGGVEAASAYAHARDPYGWLRSLNRWLDEFTDPVLTEVAGDEVEATLTRESRRLAVAEVIRYLQGLPGGDGGVDPEARRSLLRAHVLAVQQGLSPADLEAARSAVELAELETQPRERILAARHAGWALDWLPVPAGDGDAEALLVRALVERGEALQDVGRPHDALPVFRELCAVLSRQSGADHPDVLRVRSRLASCRGEAGRVGEAVEEFRLLLSDRARVLGPGHHDTLATRHNLAHWLGRSGRTQEAEEEYRRLLADQVELLGSDHPNTLTTRGRLARALGEAGRKAEAVEEFRRLLADAARVLGSDHPDTLAARGYLARWLGEAGRLGEAAEELRRVLEDRVRVLGSDHPDTLATRGSLARWLGRLGQASEAAEEYRRLLADQVRVLGADHPDTLITRGRLARWLGEAGRAEEAVGEYRRLVADQTRVLGADHLYTLTARFSLARWLGEAGRLVEAVAEFRRVLEDRERVLGADHPDTLTARSNLARWLGRSGRLVEAVAEFRRVLEDRERVLGVSHPHTVTTRDNLEYWLRRLAEGSPSAGPPSGPQA